MSSFLKNLLLCLILFSSAQANAKDFSALFKTLNPSVVVLNTYSDSGALSDVKITEKGLGTGILIDKEKGWILTAAHVVHDQDSVHVKFISGEKRFGKVLASEPMADVSLLQVHDVPTNIQAVNIGDSDLVKTGHEVVVIGSPLGFEHTLTIGHISARYQPKELKTPFFQGEFFQTDAAINPGNSGGPMFNAGGELIGIVSHIITKTGGHQGLGFAVTSNSIKSQLLEGPHIWSGITIVPVTETLAEIMHYPHGRGALVQKVALNSTAYRSGLRGGSQLVKIGKREVYMGGDIITSVAGVKLAGRESYPEIKHAVSSHIKQNKIIDLVVYRKGELITIPIDINNQL